MLLSSANNLPHFSGNRNISQSLGRDVMLGKESAKPQLSLPKGGGAIRGLGESFQPNEFTGTAGLSIPIPTSPCRGFEPGLGVEYSSGSGNGVFGIGFGLPIPNVSRKTATGIPRYLDDGTDVFLLSNAEDLVPIDGGTSDRQLAGKTYTVASYRPRLEGLFARIEHWKDAQTGDSHWRVVSKENVTSIFGKTAENRIADPDNPGHVCQWLLTETFDAKGNRIVYEYKAEDGVGIGQAIYEQNRAQTAQKYLKKICYGNTTPYTEGKGNGSQWLFEVVFDYGEHDLDVEKSNPYKFEKTWANRQDPFSTYHAGFEIRTHRLCRHILMFHRFAELGPDPVLVHATHFNYEESPVLTRLKSVESIGYRYENGKYQSQSLPPLEFAYTAFKPEQQTFKPLLSENGQPLPGFNLPPDYQLVDLYGEGIPGILYSDGISTLYSEAKDNGEGETRYCPPRTLPTLPIEGNRQKINPLLLDLTGNGQLDLVVSSPVASGYYEANYDRTWKNFQTFPAFPTDYHNPHHHMVDVTGDGLADVLLMEQDRISVWPSLGKEGFGKPYSRPPEAGVSLPKPGAANALVQFADLLGSGTQHLIRIANGKVECWPNLGYGRIGKPIVLGNAPRFGEDLDASRLFLADIDGSGTLDLVYAYPDRLDVYYNHSGNAFSEAQSIPLPAKWDRLNQIQFADIHGNGTTCVIFSENHPRPRHWCCDFSQQQKPYLLNRVINNLGAESTITYCSSTKFYLEDKKNGTPWIVNLPFPVQVVAKTETMDLIAGTKLVSTYTYHHGHYDGIEREFRGFGRVERQDAETLTENSQPTDVPPVLTKTWHHTGAWEQQGPLSRQYAKEYFQGDADAYAFPDSVFDCSLSPHDANAKREAHVALKGSVLRQEVYALDQSALQANPYTVTETNFLVKLLQAQGKNQHGVFFVHPQETLTYHYERNPNDPRIQHEFVLETTPFGNVTKACAVHYGRRDQTGAPAGDAGMQAIYRTVHPEQKALKATVQTASFIEQTEAFRLIGVPYAQQSYELNGLDLPGNRYFSLAEIRRQVDEALAHSIAYGAPFTDNAKQTRLISWQQSYFWDAEQANMLPLGQISAQALPHHQQHAVFSNEWLEAVYSGKLDKTLIKQEAGYFEDNGYWWNKGLVQHYLDPQGFYLPHLSQNDFAVQESQADGLKVKTSIEYDAYHLLPIKTESYLTDTEKNVTTASIDYHTLAPSQLTDANGIIHQARFDPLGMVIATSMFKEAQADNPRVGDGDLQTYTQQKATFDDVIANPAQYLGSASSYFYYDLFAWKNRQQPANYISLVRQTHVSDLQPGQTSIIQISLGYSDGFGREIASKQAVEPNTVDTQPAASQSQPTPAGVSGETPECWLVSGRKVFNNKGKPAKQYLPYLSNTPHYETQQEITGDNPVPPTVIHYDPLLREIRIDTPKGFFTKVEFTPWASAHYDENDTVKDSPYYQHFNQTYPSIPTEQQKNEKDALDKAALFHNTPHVTVLDSLGNALLDIQYLSTSEPSLVSYHRYDILGREVESIDARLYASNNTQGTAYYNFKYQYPMDDDGKHPASVDSTDAGHNLSLNNIFGSFWWNRSPRNFEQVIEYDRLQRKTQIRVKGFKDDGTPVTDNIVETFVYGEGQADSLANNLRGQVYRHQDQSGQIVNARYNIQGQLLETTRQFAENYRDYINWDESKGKVALQKTEYSKQFAYNALGQQFPAHKCLYKTIGCVSRLHSCAVHVEYRLECAGKPS